MRLLSRLILFVLALVGTAAAAQAPGRIVAVGDLHGDYAAFSDILQAAGLVDSAGHWSGGTATLVQLGDIPDRGPDSLKIVRRLMQLEREAERAGGKVVPLVGNHEAMMMTGDLRYVDPGEYAAFADKNSVRLRENVWEINRNVLERRYASPGDPRGRRAKARWLAETPLGKLEHQRAWSARGELGRWVATHQAVALIGNTLFAHGGLSVETVATPRSAVNQAISDALVKGNEKALTDPLGPLWYRGNVDPAPVDGRSPPADEVTRVLRAYGAQRLVVGHTPQIDGIAALHGARVLCIDTGNSAAYGGPHSFLEIVGGTTIAHERRANSAWTARALPQPQGDGT